MSLLQVLTAYSEAHDRVGTDKSKSGEQKGLPQDPNNTWSWTSAFTFAATIIALVAFIFTAVYAVKTYEGSHLDRSITIFNANRTNALAEKTYERQVKMDQKNHQLQAEMMKFNHQLQLDMVAMKCNDSINQHSNATTDLPSGNVGN